MKQSRETLNHWALMMIAAIAMTASLIYTRPVMLPLVIAIFCFFVVAPVVTWFRVRLGLPKWLSFLVTALSFLILSSLLVLLVASSLDSFVQGINEYKEKVLVFSQKGMNWLSGWGLPVEKGAIRSRIADMPLFSMAKSVTGGVLTFVGNFLLIVVFVLFLMLGHDGTKPKSALLTEIQNKISRYVATKFLVSTGTGLLVGLVLGIVGVDLALMFGVVAFLLNFIPSIGSIVATLLPLPVILLQFGLGGEFWVAFILTAAIQVLVGNIIEPKLMGEGMDLHPVTVLFFLLFWGLVWGMVGMFLAVPITAIAKIILSRIDSTKPIAELLAGRMG